MNSQKLDQITATTLLEDLKSSETKTKINALKNLRGISFALGRERTRKELLPFLSSCIEEEEDEVLIELAKILSNFIDCIGGKQYVIELINIFETLLCVDEANIRAEAINSLQIIIKQVSITDIEQNLVEMLNRLGQNDSENQKISSIQLISFLFPILNEKNKNNCRELITKFSLDESLTIKKELMNSLPKIINSLYPAQIRTLIDRFISDQNDNMRMGIMDILVSLSTHPNQGEFIDYIISILNKLANEEKWRIKLTVGDKVCSLLTFKSANVKLKQCVVDIFDKFLTDPEPEIRNISCIKLSELAEKVGKEELLDKILVDMHSITKDTTSYVRGALAGNLLKVTPLIGIKKTNEFIIPIFLDLLKDENHDIRMTLLKTLDQLDEVIKIDQIIQSIIPSFIEISSNKSWRIRIQIIDVVPVLAKILDKNNFLDKIFAICIASLTDPVFAVREASCKLIKNLYINFKGEEYTKRVDDKLYEMSSSTSYLVRNTVVMFIRGMCEEETKDIYRDFIEKNLCGIIFRLAKDKIANVRMNCASTLIKMSKICLDKEILKTCSELIEYLKKDTDNDVLRIINNINKK